METVSSQSPLAQTPQQTAANSSSSRNFKNWFDEIKAKVSRKNLVNQATNSDLAANLGDDTGKDDTQISTSNATNVQSSTAEQPAFAIAKPKGKSSGIRTRKHRKKRSDESTSVLPNRRDIRLDTTHKGSRLTSILAFFKLALSYLIPFNATLPWKLICLINTSFVIIIVGLTSGSSQASTPLIFCNGFISGLFVASICFIVLGVSFVFHFIPKSKERSELMSMMSTSGKNELDTIIQSHKHSDGLCSGHVDVSRTAGIEKCVNDKDIGDFSFFEILDHNLTQEIPERSLTSRLDDENFKGWMIEFIGDYEQRNTSEIKLKSIFVRIEDGVLYLGKPKNSNDVDTTTLPAIAHQRIYDLNKVQKFSANLLIPRNVRNKQKYVWSKKYPIRLEFQELSSNVEHQKAVQLTLLAKSCREKEEWFRRFKRIVEDNRLAYGPVLSKDVTSLKSDETFSNTSNSESLLESFRRFRRRSPSPKRDCVQTSLSSHLLNDSKRIIDDIIGKKAERESESSSVSSTASLVRTKSCEFFDPSGSHSSTSDAETSKQTNNTNEDTRKESGADDSTLTRETAELFSQAIEYSNFIESQPTFDYKEYIERIIESGRGATKTCDWFNALTGRIFFDVFSHNYWSLWFKRKIQRKLYRIRLPYFMETLTLTQINLGTNAPQFLNVVSHRLDSYGLSIDFDMSYSGGLTMTFETKLNLLKIKSDNSSSRGDTSASAGTLPSPSSGLGAQAENPLPNQDKSQSLQESQLKDGTASFCSSSENLPRESNPVITKLQTTSSTTPSVKTSGGSSTSESDHSDSDSSSDSSFEEADANEISDWEDYGAEKTRQNIVKFVDKIASSRYFQHATENRYIKKKLQDISNCPLILVVQIQSLNGVLTLNVPPPQTDRLWYGFKPTPELVLKALPKMGDREVSLSHVTDWIERKLAEEFRKILVIPNMEDIILPVLKSGHSQYVTATK